MFLMKLSYPSCWRPVADKINMSWVNWSSSIKMSGKQEVEKELDTKSKFSIKYLVLAVTELRALQFGFCRAPRCLSASRRSPSPAWSSLTATRPRTPRLGRRSSRPWPGPSCRPSSRTCGPAPCPSWPVWSATTPWWPWLSSAVSTGDTAPGASRSGGESFVLLLGAIGLKK